MVRDQMDQAAFFLGLSASGEDVVEFEDRAGQRSFLANHPDHARHVLMDPRGAYSSPYHPYKELMGFVLPSGRALFGEPGRHGAAAHEAVLDRLWARAVEGWASHGRPVAIETAAKRLMFQAVVESSFGLDAERWSPPFVEAADLYEEMWVNRAREQDVPRWPALRAAQARVLDELAARAHLTGRGGRASPETKAALVRTLLNAYNATAVAVCWTLYLLAQDPAATQRVRVALAGGDRRPLRLAVLESLRLYPPAWNLARTAAAEDRLGTTRIPAGATVHVSPYAMHRHPSWWRDPSRFDPGRFHGPLPHPFAFLPFGGGPGRCPAAPHAARHVEAAVGQVVRAADLSLRSGTVRPRGLVALRPSGKLQIAFAQAGAEVAAPPRPKVRGNGGR